MALFQMPDHSTLYQALQARDTTFDGRVYVCVKSTGIFCRLSCPARDPLPENCLFVETVAECLHMGFRPCKRCHPIGEGNEPLVTDLLSQWRANPQYQWSEVRLQQAGYDPSTVRRAFKRHFGITFLEMVRLSRVREGFDSLSTGSSVIDAQCAAGFESAGAFRSAFAKWLGRPPGSFSDDGVLKADWIDTPLGPMIAVSDSKALHLLEFIERKALATELKNLSARFNGDIGIGGCDVTDQVRGELHNFFAGKSAHFKVPVATHGSPFTVQVWEALRDIPAGETRSYSDVARAVGRPAAVRAVARANGANPLAIVVPCHRVIGADGSLTGYGGGLWRKRRLIDLERQYSTVVV